eukprot:9187769-Pyramimonas_sp.AAC.1
MAFQAPVVAIAEVVVAIGAGIAHGRWRRGGAAASAAVAASAATPARRIWPGSLRPRRRRRVKANGGRGLAQDTRVQRPAPKQPLAPQSENCGVPLLAVASCVGTPCVLVERFEQRHW